MMTARRGARPGLTKEDADEERSLWHEIRKESKRLDGLFADHNTKWERMREIMSSLDRQNAQEEETSAALEEELMNLSRQQIKLTESISASLSGTNDSDVNSLLGQIDLLAALRASSEADSQSTASQRTQNGPKNSRNPKRKADTASIISQEDRDSIAADSPAAPSPKVQIPAATRLKAHVSNSSRANSVSATREASVKLEEGTESGAEALGKTSVSSSNGGNNNNNIDKPRYVVGAEVFYRQKKSVNMEGEGILCIIHSIHGEGKQRRYEVRDVDPDNIDEPAQASVKQMTLIPSPGTKLPELPPKRVVLAQYPATTTFYRAEVVQSNVGEAGGLVRLRFENEEEEDKQVDVERRYVLGEWNGK